MDIYKDKVFTDPIDTICVFNTDHIKDSIIKIESYSKDNYVLGYIRYDLKDMLLGSNIILDKPLLYFNVYKTYTAYNPLVYPLIKDINITPSISFNDYFDDISFIKDQISLGNTYEVNYTINFDIDYNGSDIELFEYLLSMQKTDYSAFICNEFESILSFSPELFFKKQGDKIITKPMKGTIARGIDSKDDLKQIEYLKNDIKNIAENVMIVDLLRNDLSKISSKVETTELFSIETHKTLHQMTSQIEAELIHNINLFDIFCALFPCGSITGAPKISTMNIIDKIERHKRGVYCGAIGYLSPDEIIFSVPIRILQKDNNNNKWCYKSGGAITWDSNVNDEWNEVLLKSKFLLLDYKIIETMNVCNGEILFLDKHLERLKKTALALGFKFDNIDFINLKDGILRLLLSKDGSYTIEINDFIEHKTNKIIISKNRVNSNEKFLYYKTTIRPWYDDVNMKIKNNEIYDEIFLNEYDEITEGSRSNIVIQKDDMLYTPPIKCGLLNGIFRDELVRNKQCIEKKLYIHDLINADKIFCINSVRGMIEVNLET